MAPDTGNVYKGLEVQQAIDRGEKVVPISQKAYTRISKGFRAAKTLRKMQRASRRKNRN